MINSTEFLSDCMPQSASSFYHGYYTMSADMGGLILKLGLLFAGIELFHFVLTKVFDYFILPKIKSSKGNQGSENI